MTITRRIAVVLTATVLAAPDAMAQLSYTGPGGCSKGMFWPFVRSPGDCLTEAEIREGMQGTYRSSEIVDDAAVSDSDSLSTTPQRFDAPGAAGISTTPSTAESATLSPGSADPAASTSQLSDQHPADNAPAIDGPTPEGAAPVASSAPRVAAPRISTNSEDTTLAASPTSLSPNAATQVLSSPAQTEDLPDSEIAPASDNRLQYIGPGACTKGIFWPFIRRQGDCLTEAEIRGGRTGTYE